MQKLLVNYAVAVRLSEVWYFIPVIITNSLFPAIINAKKISEELYYERLQKLYDLMVWLSIGIVLPMTLLANNIVRILFGNQYQYAAGVLKIYIWAGVFVFFGCAWSKWIITENQQKVIICSHIISMPINIMLNIILIKKYGMIGAAWATLISYSINQLLGLLFYLKKLSLKMFLKTILPLRLFKIH